MALNNNQITALLTSAIAQATGGTDIAPLEVKNVIDNGTPVGENGFILTKENFTKALLDVVIKNWFKDSSYRSSYKDPFFQDSETFGAYTQAISMKYPSAEKCHSWNDFGTKENPVEIGTYKVYLPEIVSYVYGLSVSYEVNCSYTDEQWDSAFKSESDLNTFVSYIHMMVDNAIVQHLEEMDYLNRNNYIGEKLRCANNKVKGIHYVNLVKLYNDRFNTKYTSSDFLAKKECMAFATAQIKLYSDRMTKMSKLFNAKGMDRFTPKDRQVLEVLADFESQAITTLGNDSYNYNLVSMPNHITVPYWQGSGESYDLADTSAIHLTLNPDSTGKQAEVEQTGIIAILVDKWAIAHTIKKRRVVTKVFEPEAITTTFNQFREQYCTDISCNGIIFGLEELGVKNINPPTPPTPPTPTTPPKDDKET